MNLIQITWCVVACGLLSSRLIADDTLARLQTEIADRCSRIESFSGKFSVIQSIDGVAAPFRDAIVTPIETTLFWSPEGWHTQQFSTASEWGGGPMEVYFEGRVSTQIEHARSGGSQAFLSRSVPEIPCEAALWMLGVRVPFLNDGIKELVSSPSAALGQPDVDGCVTLSAEAISGTGLNVSVAITFDPSSDFRVTMTEVHRQDANRPPTVLTFQPTKWSSATNQLLDRTELIPTEASYRVSEGDELLVVATVNAQTVVINPLKSLASRRPEFPRGTRVHDDSVPGRPLRIYLTGNDADLSDAIKSQDRVINDSLAALADSGVFHDAGIPESNWRRLFVVLGVGLLLIVVGKVVRARFFERRERS